MVAMAFSIISVLACSFLAYVFLQLHRELTRPRAEQTSGLSDWLHFGLRSISFERRRYRERFPVSVN
jgi:hypothetical protein